MMILFETDKTICFSGPRPVKYEYTGEKLDRIKAILHEEISELIRSGYNTMLFGAAPGFDLICAKIALQLKTEFSDKEIEVICALPYEKFSESSYFDDYWRREYNEIIPQCKIINESDSGVYFYGCFKRRNYFMIDNSTALICLYNGKQGGTGQTYLYASKNERQIINIFKRVEKPDER